MSKLDQSKTVDIPDFKSYEEEAAWWDTHDPLDYRDPSKPMIVVHPHAPKKTKTSRVSIRLDDEMLNVLTGDAHTKGLSISTFGRMIFHEYYKDRIEKQEDGI